MKVLYFDCFSGISGDMAMAALLDLGVDEDKLRVELDNLQLEGYQLEIKKKLVSGIVGMDVKVVLEEEIHKHHHHDEHHHHHHGRNLKDIEALINNSNLKTKVKDFCLRVFREIAKAEAKVHNKSIEEVHFHEVGAVDSIVDIVGVAICLDLLEIDEVYSSAIHDGRGFIHCQHGAMPVPVPAVMEMLAGSNIPLIQTDAQTELVTPTGMGIIKCLAKEYGKMPPMKVAKTGYGMGKRVTGGFNALRVVLGEIEGNGIEDEAVLLETNIDDMNPEMLGYTMDKLFEQGALDVFYTPAYMKKNRPAIVISVLTHKQNEERLVDVLLRETTTLGIRKTSVYRYCMERHSVDIMTEYGKVAVKIGKYNDIIKASPEYDDCVKIATKSGLSLKDIYEMVNFKVRSILK